MSASASAAAATAAEKETEVLPEDPENLSTAEDEEDKDWREMIPAERVHTADVTDTRNGTFEDYALKNELLRGIYKKNWQRPSPIQEDSIPNVLSGYDVLARAKNGVGKTGSYLIPILEKVDPSLPHVQALVLVPTIELAAQTYKVCKELGTYIKGLQVVLVHGGIEIERAIVTFQKPVHMVIGTPGRMRSLVHYNNLKLDKLSIVALDEADKLLSVDFRPVIEDFVRATPTSRQMLLFSATYPRAVKDFCDTYMRNYKAINTMNELCLRGVTQYYAFVDEANKIRCLNTLFHHLNIFQSMIFCNSVRRVTALAKMMTNLGFSCGYIHARMSTTDRTRVLHDFSNKVFRHLVASDLCARGIDVPTVNVVFNFDFPDKSDAYLHRVGRAGRFGGLALAVNFITTADKWKKAQIEKELGCKIPCIPKEVDPSLYTR